MISLAAAMLLLGPPATLARPQQTYVLPIYDLVNHLTYNGMTSSLTSYFMTSGPLPATNPFANLRVFYFQGDSSHFTPMGNWSEITNLCAWSATGNQVSFTASMQQYVTGTIWVQYSGGANDSVNGAETSFVAAEVNAPQGPGQGSRPGALVPIVRVAPDKDLQQPPQNNLSVSFDLYTPFGGMWGSSSPQFWQSSGPNAAPVPGTNWSTMADRNLGASNGARRVTSTASPTSNSGYYIVGVAETYTPSEGYNNHNWTLTQFSGVIRAFNLG